jgi:hypothetical protein
MSSGAENTTFGGKIFPTVFQILPWAPVLKIQLFAGNISHLLFKSFYELRRQNAVLGGENSVNDMSILNRTENRIISESTKFVHTIYIRESIMSFY